MHEMSLCEGILQILEAEAEKQRFSRVKRVILDIGVLSGVEIPALEFAFDVVMRGSLAENAVLEINRLRGSAWCFACAETVAIEARYDPCPQCGGYQLQVNGGDEMRIQSLEVE